MEEFRQMCWDRHASVTRECSPTVRWLLVIITLAVRRWAIESVWSRAGVKAAQQRAQVCFLTPAMAERVRAEPRDHFRSYACLIATLGCFGFDLIYSPAAAFAHSHFHSFCLKSCFPARPYGFHGRFHIAGKQRNQVICTFGPLISGSMTHTVSKC